MRLRGNRTPLIIIGIIIGWMIYLIATGQTNGVQCRATPGRPMPTTSTPSR